MASPDPASPPTGTIELPFMASPDRASSPPTGTNKGISGSLFFSLMTSTAQKLPIHRGGVNINDSQEGLVEDYDECGSKDENLCADDVNLGEQNTQQDYSSQVPNQPYIGMEFSSENEAYLYYNAYARMKGFSIRRSWFRNSKSSREMIARNFVCYKQGEKYLKDKRYIGKQINRRKSIREGCPARLYIVRRGKGLWIVDKVIKEHNHILTTPSKTSKLRSHNKLFSVAKGLADTSSVCAIGPSKVAQVLFESGHESVTPQQISGHRRKNRQSNIGNECMSVIRYFHSKSATDPQFFFQFELDEDHTIRSVFWADGRSRDNYMKFGDVVVFDTSYRTNNFNMPFAPFTGVNHHRQSTLFGCALLADETEDTFAWLFRTFLTCMWEKKPKAIFSDQDLSMRAIIPVIFEGTIHRYCSWHIGRNALNHVSELKRNVKFKEDYDKCIYSSKTSIEFENQWELLKDMYPSIHDNAWLNAMYDIREHWVPCYMKDVFMAGMSTSQSINSFFDGYVHSQTPISEFVFQYDRALSSRRNAEEREDLLTMTTNPILLSSNPIEAQAGKEYTRTIFTLFQNELKKGLSYVSQKIAKTGNNAQYHVWKHGKEYSPQSVIFNSGLDISAFCSCKKFEHEGILCHHILLILWKKRVDILPEKYILRRWTIQTRYDTSTLSRVDVPSLSNERFTPMMLWDLQSTAFKLADIGSSSIAQYEIVKHGMDDLLKKLSQVRLNTIVEPSSSVASVNREEQLPTEFVVKDLTTIRKTKERPKNSQRIKSSIKVSLSQSKKVKKNCKGCGQEGHYINTCPNTGSSLGHEEH